MNGRMTGTAALPGVKVSMAAKTGQPKIMDAFEKCRNYSDKVVIEDEMGNATNKRPADRITDSKDNRKYYRHQPMDSVRIKKCKLIQEKDQVQSVESGVEINVSSSKAIQAKSDQSTLIDFESSESMPSSWNCRACTYLNENKPHALVCAMCGTPKR
jgi:rubrerythrin